jgi:hypothetical protein
MRQQPTITLEPWSAVSFGERLALEAVTALLWPLQSDKRMTVVINLLADQIENDDQIDAISDMLKLCLKEAGQGHDPQRS